jgi:Integrase zinc binding domain
MDNDLYTGLLEYLHSGSTLENAHPDLCALIKKIAHHYELEKSVVYKLDESRQGTLDSPRGRQHRNRRIVIPRPQLHQLLKQLHDHPLAGHQGQDNTYQKTSEYYYWPGMKNDVQEYVRTCKICQKRQ